MLRFARIAHPRWVATEVTRRGYTGSSWPSKLRRPDQTILVDERVIENAEANHAYATVPASERTTEGHVEQLEKFITQSRSLLVVTGAGISTESNIPDYRSPGIGLYTKGHTPTTFRQFVDSLPSRQRFWARNFYGHREYAASHPNKAHEAVAHLEKLGHIHHVITQNVDGLHHRAGSVSLTELHGMSRRVRCLSCDHLMDRNALQTVMEEQNAHWQATVSDVGVTPDGDVDLIADYTQFVPPSCPECVSGILKPDVVFFGESVPKLRAERAWAACRESDAVLVIGSSLQVWSAFRFVRDAHSSAKPVAIVNIGPTRGDAMATVRMEVRASTLLTRVLARIA